MSPVLSENSLTALTRHDEHHIDAGMPHSVYLAPRSEHGGMRTCTKFANTGAKAIDEWR